MASASARSPARIGPSRTRVARTPDWVVVRPSSALAVRSRRPMRITALRRRVTVSSSNATVAVGVTLAPSLDCR